MRDTTREPTWASGDEIKAERCDEGVAMIEVDLDARYRALLAEALRLTGYHDAGDIMREALRELVERRRFQSWVAQREHAERSGRA